MRWNTLIATCLLSGLAARGFAWGFVQEPVAPATAQPAAQAPPDPIATMVARLDLETYKATIKGLTQFGDRRQGTDRNRAALDWIEAQLKSYGCTNTERITYTYPSPGASDPDAPARGAGAGAGGAATPPPSAPGRGVRAKEAARNSARAAGRASISRRRQAPRRWIHGCAR